MTTTPEFRSKLLKELSDAARWTVRSEIQVPDKEDRLFNDAVYLYWDFLAERFGARWNYVGLTVKPDDILAEVTRYGSVPGNGATLRVEDGALFSGNGRWEIIVLDKGPKSQYLHISWPGMKNGNGTYRLKRYPGLAATDMTARMLNELDKDLQELRNLARDNLAQAARDLLVEKIEQATRSAGRGAE